MLETGVFERQILDALPGAVYASDLDGRLTSVSHARWRPTDDGGAARTPGSDDLRGRLVWEAVAGGPAREDFERAMGLLRTGRAPLVQWEYSAGTADDERVLLMQATPLHDDTHAVSGYVFSTVDITASHRSRAALVEAAIALSRPIDLDRVLHEVGQQIRIAVSCDALAVALAGDDAPAPHFAYTFGYDADPRALEQRLAPAWLESLSEQRVVVAPGESETELTAPMVSADGLRGAVTVLVDGTDSPARLEEVSRLLATLAEQAAVAIGRARLVRRTGQKQRVEAVGEVAAGVAHELRNPLFGISSAAQLLRFRAREDPVVETNVGRILREAERLNRIVTALLEFGRPITLKLSPADPDAVWDAVLESARGRLESRSIAVRRTRPVHAAGIPIDAEQLAQVFSNILNNAADAAPEATDLVLHSATLPNGGWRCRLTNTGPAIPPELLPRVFEIFFSTKPGATGIGLALCQRIVEDHHGTITVESVPEQGTTVTVTLPPG